MNPSRRAPRFSRRSGSGSRSVLHGRGLRFESLESRQLLSLQPQLVADINPAMSAEGSHPPTTDVSCPVEAGGAAYFVAATLTTGAELWKADGTTAGTVLVKDVCAGSRGSYPRHLTNVNGTLFFEAEDSDHGAELWRSDGTAEGTVLVKDVCAGSGSAYPQFLVNARGNLFFSASDGTAGMELWRSDGTAAGTVLVKDIFPGAAGSFPSRLAEMNGTVFFSASSESVGQELWKSDGTAAGTVLVKDVRPGIGSSEPRALTNVDGTLLFLGGEDLWKSDGTTAGTIRLKTFVSDVFNAYPRYLTDVHGTVFFYANDGASGQELWKSDGTVAGTVLVKDLWAGSGSSRPRQLTNVNGTLLFAASDPANGEELWKSNGTAAGTVLVRNIVAGADSSRPTELTNAAGTLYFNAWNAAAGYELWKSNGTAAGTVLVKDLRAGSASSYPSLMANINGNVFFRAYEETHGLEFWKSDGTAAGTFLLKDIRAGSQHSHPRYLADVAGTLFFQANDGIHGDELWKSDGTAAGTVPVTDLRAGSRGSYPRLLTNVNGTLFFRADDDTRGSELWKSDGTAAGTVRVSDGLAELWTLTNVNGTLFFCGNDGSSGWELWKSDGTQGGTVRVKDIYAGPENSRPSFLTDVNGTVFFSAYDGTRGTELWKSDGTSAGTVPIKDIRPGLAGSAPQYLANVSGTLFFCANGNAGGFELWKSDGTGAGTVLVKDILAGPDSSYPAYLTNVSGTLFFRALDAARHRGIWKSDGTATGTALLYTFPSDGSNQYPKYLTNVNGTLFFRGYDASNGEELWISDGSEAGTFLLADIAVPGGSNPFQFAGTGVRGWTRSQLANVGGTLFFAASDEAHGTELWHMVDVPDTTPPCVTAIVAAPGTSAGQRTFTVTFSERVRNVSAEDFRLTTTGTACATVGAVAEVPDSRGTQYTVTVQEITGTGSLRLDLASGTDVQDLDGNIAGPFSDGPTLFVPIDVRMDSVLALGADQVAVSYEITGSLVVPFGIGFFRSTDSAFNAGDVLLGTVHIAAAEDLAIGLHTKILTLGAGPGQIALPAAGAEEDAFDYFLLGVADPAGLIDETGAAAGETNNTAALAGAYHVAGGPVMVHGTGAADVIRILPDGMRVEVNGTTFTYAGADALGVRVRGHGDDDRFEFTAGTFGTAGSLDVLFLGGPGANSAQIWGSNSTRSPDTASLTPTWGSLVGPGYSLLAKDTTAITVDGQGGPDKAYLYDSAKDDTFTAWPTNATLSGPEFVNRADNFPCVYAYAASAGTDTARFFAGEGNGVDLFSGSPVRATMTGPNAAASGGKYFNRAENFEVAIGDAADSEPDVATLYDSDQTTASTQYSMVLDAGQQYGEVQNGTASIRANHFVSVVVATRDQGADRAEIYGSPGIDTLHARLDVQETWLTSAGFKYRASQVKYVAAYSASGQEDRALFYDSDGSDTFRGGPGFGQMSTPGGASVSAAHFRYVTAYSTHGGADTAMLAGKPGTVDYFVGRPAQASLGDSPTGAGSTYYDWLVGFESVQANGQPADGDSATLYGTAGADTFLSDFFPVAGTADVRDPDRPYAMLFGTGFSNTAASFRYVTAVGGANDLAHLYAASAADAFLASPRTAVISGTTFYHEAKGFGEVHGHGTGAPASKARLHDASLHVLLEVAGTAARLSPLTAVSESAVWAEDFGDVTAVASPSLFGDKKRIRDHVFALHLVGQWTDM